MSQRWCSSVVFTYFAAKNKIFVWIASLCSCCFVFVKFSVFTTVGLACVQYLPSCCQLQPELCIITVNILVSSSKHKQINSLAACFQFRNDTLSILMLNDLSLNLNSCFSSVFVSEVSQFQLLFMLSITKCSDRYSNSILVVIGRHKVVY